MRLLILNLSSIGYETDDATDDATEEKIQLVHLPTGIQSFIIPK